MAQNTALYETHQRCGGRIVEFAGWNLPVQYAGVLAEHRAVRQAAGLFDVSHMGEILFTGPQALRSILYLITNDISKMKDGDVRYSPMCNEAGGTVDDVLVYREGAERFLVVVNAANRQKDYAWMLAHNPFGAAIADVSDGWAQLALQGPRAAEILARALPGVPQPERYYTFLRVSYQGAPMVVSRTGYTGEDGFELYLNPANAPALWDGLLAAGEPLGLVPAGLGARDTLRLEAAMPLYGHELRDDLSPLEAGLGRFVKLDREDFVGRAALLAQKTAGIARKRVGLEIIDRGIAREGAPVLQDGKAVGVVTSGTMSPTLERAIAMAMVPKELAEPGTTLAVDVRGKALQAKVVKLPFYIRSEEQA